MCYLPYCSLGIEGTLWELAFRRGVRGFELLLRLRVKSRYVVMPRSGCGRALASSVVPEEELSASRPRAAGRHGLLFQGRTMPLHLQD